jgi:DNA repair and recombination protein RAD54B
VFGYFAELKSRILLGRVVNLLSFTMKPFRPPLLKQVEKQAKIDLTESDSEDVIEHRPYKKRKLLERIVPESPPKNFVPASPAAFAPRKPLLVVKNPAEIGSKSGDLESPEGYYIVLWYVKSKAFSCKHRN